MSEDTEGVKKLYKEIALLEAQNKGLETFGNSLRVVITYMQWFYLASWVVILMLVYVVFRVS